jgi:polyphosphate glucokinase
MAQQHTILGIDVGASGIKGAIVDVLTGQFIADRFRVPMPQPSTPAAVAEAIDEIRANFNWKGPIGIGFPSVVKNGVIHTASNIEREWIGTNVEELIHNKTGLPVFALNDADAAGLAEMRFGVGKGQMGSVMMLTIGTGIGSAMFYNGNLTPNTELGHLYMFNGRIAEHYCADSAKKRENLSWSLWAMRFNDYLKMVDFYFRPDLILLGGGTSKHFDTFKSFFDSNLLTRVKPAELLNNAGIIGAAMYAYEQL